MSDPAVVIRFSAIPPDVVVHRRRGRPKKVGTRPLVCEMAYQEQVSLLSAQHVASDPLVVHLGQENAPVDRTLDLLIEALSREQAAISWECRRAVAEGKADAPQTMSRRIDSLLRVFRVVVERERLRREQGVLPPDAIEKVRTLFFAEVGKIAREILPEELARQMECKLAEHPHLGTKKCL